MERDANPAFFHASIKARGRRNFVSTLRVDDGLVERVAGVRNEVDRYFSQHYSGKFWDRPCLKALFSNVEIEDVVRSCDGNNNLGPDGFNFSFIKAYWLLLKGELEPSSENSMRILGFQRIYLIFTSDIFAWLPI